MKIMKQIDSTLNEIELYTEINHENIVRYFDHFHMRIGDEIKTFLITEFCQVSRLNNSPLYSFRD